MATATPIRNERLRVVLRGAVQGAGLRPTIFRIATELGLAGWVRNTGAGLVLEVESSPEQLDTFLRRLEAQSPPAAVVTSREISRMEPAGTSFCEILPSVETAAPTPTNSKIKARQALGALRNYRGVGC